MNNYRFGVVKKEAQWQVDSRRSTSECPPQVNLVEFLSHYISESNPPTPKVGRKIFNTLSRDFNALTHH